MRSPLVMYCPTRSRGFGVVTTPSTALRTVTSRSCSSRCLRWLRSRASVASAPSISSGRLPASSSQSRARASSTSFWATASSLRNPARSPVNARSPADTAATSARAAASSLSPTAARSWDSSSVRRETSSHHLEPGPYLVALRLDCPELGAIVSILESGDQFAGGDPLALVDVDLSDDSVDLGAHVRIVARGNRELARDRELPRHEEERGQHEGEEQDHPHASPHRDPAQVHALAPRSEPGSGRPALQRILEREREQTGVGDRPGALIALGQKAAHDQRNLAKEPRGVAAGEEAVREIDPALPGRRRHSRRAWRYHESGEAALEIAERARAEVVDPEGVAEQIVAVELDQRGEVDEEPEGGCGDHHQRDSAGPGARLRDPPDDDGQSPEEQLQVRPGDGHPEALGLLGEEPGIAHVAVEGRLKVDEHEPYLMNMAPEPLAGEAVRELVRRRDHESDKPRHQEHLDTPQAPQVSGDVTPFRHSDNEPEHDDRGGEHQEGRREAEIELVDQPVQEAVGIEGAEPQVQWAATSVSARGGRTLKRSVVGLEQPEPPERPDEPFDHPRLG